MASSGAGVARVAPSGEGAVCVASSVACVASVASVGVATGGN